MSINSPFTDILSWCDYLLAFGAPRTTPINNLLIKAEITPIERLELIIAQISKAFSFAKNSPPQTVLQKIKNA